MKNYIIKLPEELYSIKGMGKAVQFSMNRKQYRINGVTYKHSIKITEYDLYYKHTVLNTVVLVTLFQSGSILP